ncbi:MAG: hypothetical protein GY728_09100 [Phycisphaeraceae bacterium]|nr:hypothetical protein [Phycisphaeraceae bacterium]MCP4795893.1 hypothetical protein [Phycisphaeraceae bacterium]
MNIDPRQLLRRLEPAVRPAGIGSAEGRASVETADFDDLLARAADGEFASGRSIDQARLEEPVEDRFAERLAGIADAAEAAGYERVLVIAEDRPLLLEVAERRIDGELAADDASSTPLLPIDAAVRLGDAEATPTSATGPVATSLPTGIVEALEHASTGPESESPSITRDDAA